MERKRLLIVFGSVCLSLMLIVSLLAGCAPEEEEEVVVTPEEEEEEVAPAVEEEVYRLTYQSYVPTGGSNQWITDWWVEAVETAAGGQLDIEVFDAGTVCGSFELFDTVSSGGLDMCHNTSAYLFGSVPCIAYGWGIGGMLPTYEESAWLYWYLQPRSWQDILRDALVESNVYSVDFGPDCNYGIFMATVPINRLADLDGLMIRSFGDIGLIWQASGAELVTVPAAEMYTALALGTIDAANWGGISGFVDLSIEEICPYLIGPPIMGYGEQGLLMNLDVWNSLPANLQEILSSFSQLRHTLTLSNMMYTGQEALQYMIEDWGTTYIEWPQEDVDTCMALALELTFDKEPKDEWCAERVEVLRDYMEFLGYL